MNEPINILLYSEYSNPSLAAFKLIQQNKLKDSIYCLKIDNKYIRKKIVSFKTITKVPSIIIYDKNSIKLVEGYENIEKLCNNNIKQPYTRIEETIDQLQPPMMQGQPPMMQGQPPMMQGQPPMMQGQPPMMQGQPPMMQGQMKSKTSLEETIKNVASNQNILNKASQMAKERGEKF